MSYYPDYPVIPTKTSWFRYVLNIAGGIVIFLAVISPLAIMAFVMLHFVIKYW